ncbi:pyridoxamine 5'-phosphate oxidase family protein [Alkalicoccus saliphilus]|jgi:general stress protein 26|uniref:General stress protein n=1 Tax=Alkalicoccus saliphilus TaxID=200989 RepID=A0A2T4U4C3_9BACI|nr:pyridoxamine 5'-phosphate oxidase family protein [Alkalicoccus saliphilus]PTL38257.1 general stress protein [Alkalicoccus saliphilus]
MDQKQVRQRIEEIIDNNAIGILSTVENNKPYARYMTFLNKDKTMYTPTSRETYKVEEIDKNSNVHVLLGYQGEGFGDEYVEVTGTASIRDDKELIEDLWTDELDNWFDGKDDPKLIFLEIKPEYVRLMNGRGEPPHSLDL